ncbi:hypothetical protein CHS0354_007132 [Potamilus streckersoni]|uniref:Uncharacterized protein n=1 Tax=Potamilus streckersoni TaxID=2493646 RepID=A0AAE0VYC5_9BIVA|nr:hypothetical protein CHS0354_007132 [Potamilus streckersoni]
MKRGNDTASNLSCRTGHSCGKYGYSYTWCYTDRDNSWDYCCDSACKYFKDGGLRCYSGKNRFFCGNPGTITAIGKPCRSSHTCGSHDFVYYWCYTNDSWDYCCHPGTKCTGGYCSASTFRGAEVFMTQCKTLA